MCRRKGVRLRTCRGKNVRPPCALYVHTHTQTPPHTHTNTHAHVHVYVCVCTSGRMPSTPWFDTLQHAATHCNTGVHEDGTPSPPNRSPVYTALSLKRPPTLQRLEEEFAEAQLSAELHQLQHSPTMMVPVSSLSITLSPSPVQVCAVRVFVYVRVCVRVRMLVRAWMWVSVCLCLCAPSPMSKFICLNVCMRVCIYICVYIRTHTRGHTRTYIYTHGCEGGWVGGFVCGQNVHACARARTHTYRNRHRHTIMVFQFFQKNSTCKGVKVVASGHLLHLRLRRSKERLENTENLPGLVVTL